MYSWLLIAGHAVQMPIDPGEEAFELLADFEAFESAGAPLPKASHSLGKNPAKNEIRSEFIFVIEHLMV